MVTFEEASRCPKCDNPGEQKEKRADRTHDLYIFTCQNKVCLWYQTDWVVQRNSDGTIPEREVNRLKTFPVVPGMSQEKAIEQVKKTIKDEERGKRGR